MPKISVVMPVYNAISGLKKAVDSILEQTYTDFELIIINDFGSDDGSKELIEEYIRKDTRVKLIQLEQRVGLAESLNIGIDVAKGKYIARMDADDYSYPCRLRMEFEYMEQHPECVLCGSRYRVITPTYSYVSEVPLCDEDIKLTLLFTCAFGHPTVMFKRKIFEDNGWKYDGNFFCEDFELWTRINGMVSNLPEVLLDYNYDEDSKSLKYNEILHRNSCDIVKKGLKEKLAIKTEKYEDKLFWLGLPNVIRKANDIQMAFYLLKDIEHQNDKLKLYSSVKLAQFLCARWNQYVWHFFVMGNEKDMLPFLEYKGQLSFYKAFADGMHISKEQVENVIESKIKAVSRVRITINYGYIVFGTGEACRRFFDAHLELLSYVKCFSDNNKSKWGKTIYGKKIVPSIELENIKNDGIVITSAKFFNEIRVSLKAYYGDDMKIYSIGILERVVGV